MRTEREKRHRGERGFHRREGGRERERERERGREKKQKQTATTNTRERVSH